jgi:toxin ParE1/3/4
VKSKTVIPREQANRDVDDAIAYYLSEAPESVAFGFIDALERAYTHIGRRPAAGSTRHAHELDLPGLRSWPLKRYPYLIFYMERPEHIDVWRILHSRRNIPEWMQQPEAT